MTSTLMEAYLAEVHTLWPAAEPRLAAGRQTGDGVLVALPSAERPRLLVPAANGRAAARAMLRFSAGLDLRDAITRIGVAGALRTPARRAFSDRVVTGGDAGSLRSYLEQVLGQPVDVSLGIGTARANRKPVLQVFDRKGHSLAFVKVGSTRDSEPHVAAEAEGLRRVGAAVLPGHFEVPRLLHLGRHDGHLVVVMSALDTWCWQRPQRMWRVPTEDMTTFARSFGDTARPLTETPLWTRLLATRQTLAGEASGDRLSLILDRLAGAAARTKVELGAWHGDWTPWNMSRRQGRLQLWDFERFETGVPLGLDRYHYCVNAVLRRDGVSPASVARGLAMAGAEGARPGDAEHLLAATYLAAISARYLEQAQSGLGDTVLPRAQAMLETLEAWLSVDAEAGGST